MGTNKKLTIFIPGLSETRLTSSLWGQYGEELTAFNHFFSKAKTSKNKALPTLSRYFELFQLLEKNWESPNNLPLASISYSNCLSQNNLKKGESSNIWVYNVSPVFLHPDMAQLVLAEDLTQQISDSQAKIICHTINVFFNETDQDHLWELVYYARNQWFITSKQQLINQPIPSNEIGRPLIRPKTDNAMSRYWVQTLNEIQMLIHNAPKLESKCNSLWLWGESQINSKEYTTKANRWDIVFSGNIIVKQLAQYTKTKYINNFDLPSVLDETQEYSCLIILDELESAIKSEDTFTIIEVLQQYERKYFIPLKAAILANPSLSVELISTTGHSYFINRKYLKHWWKRTKLTGNILEFLCSGLSYRKT